MNIEKTKTMALTVIQRAIAAIGITPEREKELRDLAARTNGINTITNKDGYQQVHSGRMALKNERISIQALAKEARDDATKFSRAVIAEEKRIIGLIQPEENRLQQMQDAYDAAIEAERQAKIDAELKRVADINARRDAIRSWPLDAAGKPSSVIEQMLSDADGYRVTAEMFGEFVEQAQAELEVARLALKEVLSERRKYEAEQARIKAEREELARLRAEQEKQQAEERAEDERRRAEAEKQIAAERARIAEEERKAKAERDAEAARQAAELKAAREKQEAEAAAERKRIADEEAAAKAIREAEAKRLADERAEFERQQAEARHVKEEEERVKREQARLASIKKPADAELLGVLAAHYQVPVAKATEWVLAMNLRQSEAA